ncbi:MAG: hypothetical protein JSR93_02035 [Verrucomicrobia bacterium]|nr:hypothetical protein [Verrucomicrobiota bacterium]
MQLLRGRFALLFNYRGVMQSSGVPDGRATCIDGLYAANWFKERLRCENHEVCVMGTSMGSGAAVYTAAKLPGADLINEDLLPNVQGRVLIIEAVNDQLIPSSHAERLFHILVRSKIPHAENEEIAAFASQYWIRAPGSHSSIPVGDTEYSWYRDPNTQARLSQFLTKPIGIA